MTKDTGTNGTLKIRRSTLELILIALLGAGGGGGAAKMLLPDKGAAAQDYAVVQQTLEEIKTEGTALSRSNDKRIMALETRFEYMQKSLENIQEGQALIIQMLRGENGRPAGRSN